MSQINGHPSTSTDAPADSSKVSPGDVGWQFVPQYYNFVNKQPHRLHCFYNKRSTFIHGEEGDDVTPALGQQEIHERIVKIGYDQCKVYINSIDSQSSAGGGIIIQVLGEMSNANKPWRKFAQTFFLAEQPNGYFVLNDIFRYLKEDTDDDDEPDVEEAPVVSAAPANKADQAHAAAAPTAPVAVEEEVQSVAETEPEPEQAAPAPVAEPKAEPKAAPAPVETPAPVKETPVETIKSAEPTPAPKAAPTPSPVPTPAESKPATPAPNGASSTSTPAPAATSVPASTPAATPAATTAAASTPAPAPAAPAAPAKPKSWASLAAGGKGWASVAAGASAASPAAAAPKKAEAPAAAPAASTPAPAAAAPAAAAPAPASNGGRHPFYENAMKVNTPHCFVKLPNWSVQEGGSSAGGEVMDEPTLRQLASRFGDVVKVEIVKGKACAFIEFAKVESARKAIVASLTTHQGGEGGVNFADGKINFETRKEKDERGPKGGRRTGGAPEGRTGGGNANTGGRTRTGGEGGVERGANAGRGRGRGRGGANNGGDRAAK